MARQKSIDPVPCHDGSLGQMDPKTLRTELRRPEGRHARQIRGPVIPTGYAIFKVESELGALPRSNTESHTTASAGPRLRPPAATVKE
jgi:hypothetical protein